MEERENRGTAARKDRRAFFSLPAKPNGAAKSCADGGGGVSLVGVRCRRCRQRDAVVQFPWGPFFFLCWLAVVCPAGLLCSVLFCSALCSYRVSWVSGPLRSARSGLGWASTTLLRSVTHSFTHSVTPLSSVCVCVCPACCPCPCVRLLWDSMLGQKDQKDWSQSRNGVWLETGLVGAQP